MASGGGTQTRDRVSQDTCLTLKILYDYGTPAPPRIDFPDHSEERSAKRGWLLAEEVGVEPTRHLLDISTALKAARPTGDDALPIV